MVDASKKRKDQRKFAESEDNQEHVDAQAFDELTVLQDAPQANLSADHLTAEPEMGTAEDIAASGNLNYQAGRGAVVQDLIGSGVDNPGLENLAGSVDYEIQSSGLEAVAGNNMDIISNQEEEALASGIGVPDTPDEQSWYDIVENSPMTHAGEGEDQARNKKSEAEEWEDLLEAGAEDITSGGEFTSHDNDIGSDGGFG